MGQIEERKLALQREIERRERKLEELEAMPDFSTLADGTVLGMLISLGRSQPYAFIGYKVRDLWYVTGKNGLNGVSSDALLDWLTTGGRRLQLAVELAQFGVQAVAVESIDLADMLAAMAEPPTRRRGSEWRDRVCGDDSCGCSGKAHP